MLTVCVACDYMPARNSLCLYFGHWPSPVSIGLQGGAPIRIDHAKVLALWEKGLMFRDIAAEFGISMPSVTRFPRER